MTYTNTNFRASVTPAAVPAQHEVVVRERRGEARGQCQRERLPKGSRRARDGAAGERELYCVFRQLHGHHRDQRHAGRRAKRDSPREMLSVPQHDGLESHRRGNARSARERDGKCNPEISVALQQRQCCEISQAAAHETPRRVAGRALPSAGVSPEILLVRSRLPGRATLATG